MSLQLRWCGIEERQRVAQARWESFGLHEREKVRFEQGIATDHGTCPTEFLLAEIDGLAVGTATIVPMTMWVRGNPITCQGVAYVGTTRTHRRGAGGEKGIASRIMEEVLHRGREQGQVVSALMPFRGSFYDHFGYGFVERRTEWTIPLSILPTGDCRGMTFYKESDRAALAECKQRITQLGQCDIERTDAMWTWILSKAQDALTVVDRDEKTGIVHGWMILVHESEAGKDRVKVTDWGFDSLSAMQRHLSFLGSLRDQYSQAQATVQSDVPLNWLLKETQLPHRPVNHPVAIARPYTRMQLRVLDHQKMIKAISWPKHIRGNVTLEIKETEGPPARFTLEVEAGTGKLMPSSQTTAQFACPDRIWAAIVCGDLPASRALAFGLSSGEENPAREVLDGLSSSGPAPFCMEYF